MKKHLLGIVSLAVLAVGLASCTGESSLGSSSNSSISVSTPDSSFTPDSSDSSTSDYPEVTISLSTTEISLDVGGVLSLRLSQVRQRILLSISPLMILLSFLYQLLLVVFVLTLQL